MTPESSVFVAGHRGLVGGAVVRRLTEQGYERVLTRTRQEVDLTRQDQVEAFFAAERPQVVVLAAAKVGGILANATYPADFARDNLLIQTLVIDAAHRHGVEQLLVLGSSCIYPKHAPQPIKEEALLSGPLEPTNEAYAVAKIAGIRMAQAYRTQHGFRTICLQPTNLYGPGDNFDLEHAHVLPALMRRFHEAKLAKTPAVEVWGTGTPRREFLHVDDLAAACVFALERDLEVPLLNVGTGEDIEIRELARILVEVVGYQGELNFDRSKPDGTPRKLMDSSRLRALGWSPEIELREGIEATYRWFLEHEA